MVKNIKVSSTFLVNTKIQTTQIFLFFFLIVLNAVFREFISKIELKGGRVGGVFICHSQFKNSKHLIWIRNSVFLSSSENIFYGNPRTSSDWSAVQYCQFTGNILIWSIYIPVYLFHKAAYFRREYSKRQTLISDTVQEDKISWTQISKRSFDPPINFVWTSA